MVRTIWTMFNSTVFWKHVGYFSTVPGEIKDSGVFSKQLSKRFFAGSADELVGTTLISNFEGSNSKFFLRKLFAYKYSSFGKSLILGSGFRQQNFYSLLDFFFQKQTSAWSFKNMSLCAQQNGFMPLKEISNFSGISAVERIFFADRFNFSKAIARNFGTKERAFFSNARGRVDVSFFYPIHANTAALATDRLFSAYKGFFNFDDNCQTNLDLGCTDVRELVYRIGTPTTNSRLYVSPCITSNGEFPLGYATSASTCSIIQNNYFLDAWAYLRKTDISSSNLAFSTWFSLLKQKLKIRVFLALLGPLSLVMLSRIWLQLILLVGLRGGRMARVWHFTSHTLATLSTIFSQSQNFVFADYMQRCNDLIVLKLKRQLMGADLLLRPSYSIFLTYHKLVELVATLLVAARSSKCDTCISAPATANSFLRLRFRGFKPIVGGITQPVNVLPLINSNSLLLELLTLTQFNAFFSTYLGTNNNNRLRNLLYFRRFKKLYGAYNKLLVVRVVTRLRNTFNFHGDIATNQGESWASLRFCQRKVNSNSLTALVVARVKKSHAHSPVAIFLPPDRVWHAHDLARFGVNSTHFEFFTLFGTNKFNQNTNFGGYDPFNALRNHRNPLVSWKNNMAALGLEFFDRLASFPFRNEGVAAWLSPLDSRFALSHSFYFSPEFKRERFFNELSGGVRSDVVFARYRRIFEVSAMDLGGLQGVPLYPTYSFFFF